MLLPIAGNVHSGKGLLHCCSASNDACHCYSASVSSVEQDWKQCICWRFYKPFTVSGPLKMILKKGVSSKKYNRLTLVGFEPTTYQPRSLTSRPHQPIFSALCDACNILKLQFMRLKHEKRSMDLCKIQTKYTLVWIGTVWNLWPPKHILKTPWIVYLYF